MRTWAILSLFPWVLAGFTPVTLANIVGTGTQNFNTTANAYDFVTVHSSRTIGQGNFHLNLFLNTAVNTLPYFDEENSEYIPSSRGVYNDSLTATEAAVGYGILDNWDIGLSIPAVLHQDVGTNNEPHGEFAQRGITEFRLSSKVGLFSNQLFGLAGIVSANLNAIQDNPYDGKNAGAAINTELAGDVTLGTLQLAANLGYRVRDAGKKLAKDVPIEPHGNEFIASAAVAYTLSSWSTQWITEVFSSSPSARIQDDSGRHTTRAEAVTGLKIFYLDNLYYHVGAGTELRHSVASPDWRGYAGLNYIFGGSRGALVEQKRNPQNLRPVVTQMTEERAPDQVIVVRDIHFKFDSAEMANPREGLEVIRKLAKDLRQGERLQAIVIEGHTCSLGTDAYNRNLSQRRADAIRAILIRDHGFTPAQLRAAGQGESRPVASNKTDAGRQHNRRVEFKIYRQLVGE